MWFHQFVKTFSDLKKEKFWFKIDYNIRIHCPIIYKIFSKALATLLEPILEALIDENHKKKCDYVALKLEMSKTHKKKSRQIFNIERWFKSCPPTPVQSLGKRFQYRKIGHHFFLKHLSKEYCRSSCPTWDQYLHWDWSLFGLPTFPLRSKIVQFSFLRTRAKSWVNG